MFEAPTKGVWKSGLQGLWPEEKEIPFRTIPSSFLGIPLEHPKLQILNPIDDPIYHTTIHSSFHFLFHTP